MERTRRVLEEVLLAGTLRVWVSGADYWAVRDRLLEAVKVRLDKEGIGIPFPQLEMHPGGGWKAVLKQG